jgi:hypothetical protein
MRFIMLKNSALPLFCLLAGIGMGYGMRSIREPAEVARSVGGADKVMKPSNVRSPSVKSTGGQATSSETKTAEKEGQVAASSSIGDQMKALLDNYRSDDARSAIAGFSASELQAALAIVAAVPKSADRDSLRWNLYRAWAVTQPAAAWKAALADPLETESGYLLSAVAGEIAKTNAASAIELAMSLGAGGRRAGVLREVIDEWGKVDLPGVVAYWNSHPDLPVDNYAISSVIGRVGAKDPLGAANLALKLTDNRARSNALSSLMSNWAGKDPAAALSWAESITQPALRDKAIIQALSGWSQKDPKAAMERVQSLSDPLQKSEALSNVWQNWFRKAPNEAVAFLGLNSDPKFMENLGWSMAYALENFTAQEKLEVLNKVPEGKAKQDLFQSLAQQQMDRGRYNQALEFLNGMPDSNDRDYGLQRLGREWATADPNAAAAWLKLQPDSSDRDLAVAGFASVLARTNPQEALTWVDSIPDEGVKSSALKNLAHTWLASDPANAEPWLSSLSGMSESEKNNVRENAKKYRPSQFSYGTNVTNRR